MEPRHPAAFHWLVSTAAREQASQSTPADTEQPLSDLVRCLFRRGWQTSVASCRTAAWRQHRALPDAKQPTSFRSLRVAEDPANRERKRVVKGKSVAECVNIGGRRLIKNKHQDNRPEKSQER